MDNIIQRKRIASQRTTRAKVVAVSATPLWIKYIISIAVLSLAIYLYLVVSIILATTERKALEEKISATRTELSYKEVAYGTKLKELHLARVYELGFVEVSSPVYASKAEHALTLRSR